jgi:hypothetical protein
MSPGPGHSHSNSNGSIQDLDFTLQTYANGVWNSSFSFLERLKKLNPQQRLRPSDMQRHLSEEEECLLFEEEAEVVLSFPVSSLQLPPFQALDEGLISHEDTFRVSVLRKTLDLFRCK